MSLSALGIAKKKNSCWQQATTITGVNANQLFSLRCEARKHIQPMRWQLLCTPLHFKILRLYNMYFTLFLYVSEMISAALRFLRVLCNNAALIYYEKCLDKCLQEIRNAVQ